MTPQQSSKLDQLKSNLVAGMENNMQENCGYTQADVGSCADIIDSYVAKVSLATNPESIMGEVQVAVTRLNQLNNRCDGGLIEADQSEELCAIINKSAEYAGFEVDSDDLTEEWREW